MSTSTIPGTGKRPQKSGKQCMVCDTRCGGAYFENDNHFWVGCKAVPSSDGRRWSKGSEYLYGHKIPKAGSGIDIASTISEAERSQFADDMGIASWSVEEPPQVEHDPLEGEAAPPANVSDENALRRHLWHEYDGSLSCAEMIFPDGRGGKICKPLVYLGNGKWADQYGGGPKRDLLYRAPEVLDHVLEGTSEDPVTLWIVEGAKDADALWGYGLPATCNWGGAGKNVGAALQRLVEEADTEKKERARKAGEVAPDFDPSSLRLMIFRDKDLPGRKHAGMVAEAASRLEIAVEDIVEAPPIAGTSQSGADFSDMVMAGVTIDEYVSVLDEYEEECAGEGYQSLRDFEGEDDESRAEIVGGIWHEGDTVSINADGGVGKSTLLADLSMSILTGEPWNDHWVQESPCIVVNYCPEDAVGYRGRLRAWQKRHQGLGKLQDEGLKDRLLVQPKSPDLRDRESCLHAIKALKRHQKKRGGHPIRLISFDTLIDSAGDADEKDNNEMKAVMRNMGLFAKAFNCLTICLHHIVKGSSGGPRGAGSIRNCIESSVDLVKAPPSQQKPGENRVVLRCDKARRTQPFKPLLFRIVSVDMGKHPKTGRPRTEPLALPGGQHDSSKAAVLELRDRVANYGPGGGTVPKLVASLRKVMGPSAPSEDTLRRWLLNLCDCGHVADVSESSVPKYVLGHWPEGVEPEGYKRKRGS